MKKEWNQPTLEVLDVEMTMASAKGTHYDAHYVAGQPHQDDVTFLS